MQPDIQTTAPRGYARQTGRTTRAKAVAFLIAWALVVGAGAAGTVWYADHMKKQIETELALQTDSRIAELQLAYDGKLADTRAAYDKELAALQSKVDELNQLLTFTKDNAGTKTDNSNKLYTQLNDVKKQLAELQKNLELLQ